MAARCADDKQNGGRCAATGRRVGFQRGQANREKCQASAGRHAHMRRSKHVKGWQRGGCLLSPVERRAARRTRRHKEGYLAGRLRGGGTGNRACCSVSSERQSHCRVATARHQMLISRSSCRSCREREWLLRLLVAAVQAAKVQPLPLGWQHHEEGCHACRGEAVRRDGEAGT